MWTAISLDPQNEKKHKLLILVTFIWSRGCVNLAREVRRGIAITFLKEDFISRTLNCNGEERAQFFMQKLGAKINQNWLHLGKGAAGRAVAVCDCGGALISVQICTADASRLECNLVHSGRLWKARGRPGREACLSGSMCPSFISMPCFTFHFRQFWSGWQQESGGRYWREVMPEHPLQVIIRHF